MRRVDKRDIVGARDCVVAPYGGEAVLEGAVEVGVVVGVERVVVLSLHATIIRVAWTVWRRVGT